MLFKPWSILFLGLNSPIVLKRSFPSCFCFLKKGYFSSDNSFAANLNLQLFRFFREWWYWRAIRGDAALWRLLWQRSWLVRFLRLLPNTWSAVFYRRALALYQRYGSRSDISIELVIFEKKLCAQIRTRDGGKITIDEEVCDSFPNSRKPCETVVPDVKCLELQLQ